MSDSESDVLSVTDAQNKFSRVLALTATIPGTCLCFLVLVAYAIAACLPKARKQLDRVSFRLVVYTLVSNVLFGIVYSSTPIAPTPRCSFWAFAGNITLSFSTFFATCIAINLQLVLVHGVNGKTLERYYVIGSTLLSLALNVPTYALNQFGWDENSGVCWYKNHDAKLRLRWIIGTQSFWISLAATIETICSCVVIVWMYRFKSKTISIFGFTGSSRSRFMSRDPRYRKIILRIAMYPIVSLMVNFPAVALDLKTTVDGSNTQFHFRLVILDLLLYGVRTFAYGMLAAMDPSFINAVREMRGKGRSTGGTGGPLTSVFFTSWGAMPGTAHWNSMIQGEGNNLEIDVPLQQTNSPKNKSDKFASEDPNGAQGGSLGPEAFQRLQEGQLKLEEKIRDFEQQL